LPIGSYIYNPAVERILEDTGGEVVHGYRLTEFVEIDYSMMAIFMSERQS